jgi:hydrogenase maturation protease
VRGGNSRNRSDSVIASRTQQPEARKSSADAGFSDFGLRASFGSRISDFGFPSVLVAGVTPERCVSQLADGGFDHVVFLDAMEFGGAPGAVVLLGAEEIAARRPQVSTHKLSLGLLARMVEAGGRTRAWLLGVQPASLGAGRELSAPVQGTLEVLRRLIVESVAAVPVGVEPRSHEFEPKRPRPGALQDAIAAAEPLEQPSSVLERGSPLPLPETRPDIGSRASLAAQDRPSAFGLRHSSFVIPHRHAHA